MSDATTDMARLLSPQPGDRFELDRGAIRVDRTDGGDVVFTALDPSGRVEGPRRFTATQWREAIGRYVTRNEPDGGIE